MLLNAASAANKTSPPPRLHLSLAYVILVMIILVIIVLCSILYFLRRVSKVRL